MAEQGKYTDVSGLSPIWLDKRVWVTFPEIPGSQKFEDVEGTVTHCDAGGIAISEVLGGA